MARLPRFVISGQPQHVIQRDNDRQVIFRSHEVYEFYLEKLLDASAINQRQRAIPANIRAEVY